MAKKKNVMSRRKSVLVQGGLILVFVLVCIVILIPLFAIFLASFKDGKELIQYGLNLQIDFSKMSLKNYVFLFTGSHQYFTWFFNSVFLTVVQVVATILISACVGYGFAMYNFKGKNFWFICVLLIMMVPFEILMLPLYNQMIDMHLSNSYMGVILPFVANASTIFFFRQFLSGIPKEIIDAGRVDGASMASSYALYFQS